MVKLKIRNYFLHWELQFDVFTPVFMIDCNSSSFGPSERPNIGSNYKSELSDPNYLRMLSKSSNKRQILTIPFQAHRNKMLDCIMWLWNGGVSFWSKTLTDFFVIIIIDDDWRAADFGSTWNSDLSVWARTRLWRLTWGPQRGSCQAGWRGVRRIFLKATFRSIVDYRKTSS